MAGEIATDGQGNYVTLDSSGNWVPTAAPDAKPATGGHRFADAPPEEKPPLSSQGPGQGAFGGNARIDPLSGGELPGQDEQPPGRSFDTVVREALAPTPGKIYGDVVPLAKDPQTGRYNLTLPNMLRNPLLGLINEGPQIQDGRLVVPGATLNPETGDYGITSEAQAAGSLAAFPLRFSGTNALMRGPPATFGKPLPVTADELRAAIVRADDKPADTGPTYGTSTEGAAATREAQPGAQPPPGQDMSPTQPPLEPGAVGAQITPASELGLTPKEEAAYRSTAEGNKLLEPQEPGVRDANQYLPGERINEAEASQDVQTARELKSLRQQTPALDAQMTADEAHNNNVRTNAINNALPGRVQITAAENARQEAMTAAEPRVFANATDADVQPIVQTIQDILNDPKNRQNSQLQQYVRPLMDRLQNADGTPKITDARELWGWRQDVQHLTSSAAQRGDPNLARVSGILGNVLEATDNQIEAAAPRYKELLRDDYRTRSQQIDAMDALNAERFKLFDSQNKPNYNAVQGMVRRIIDARQTNDPYEPFTHVTQETLDKLFDIRDSMRRTAAADRLAAPKGSPTSQNLGDALRAAGRMAVQNSGPIVGGTLGAMLPIPGVGPALGIVAGTAVNHLLSERALAQRLTRGQELLSPRNTMMPPP